MATAVCYKFKSGCTYYWERMNGLYARYQRLNAQKHPDAEKYLKAAKEAFEDYKAAGGKKTPSQKELQ